MMTAEEIRDRFNAGVAMKFLLFWGPRPAADNAITKSCLSQWYEAPFEVNGVKYKTAEHFMMAEKARLFSDGDTRHRMLAAATPAAAKALGHEVSDFDEPIWEQRRSRIVLQANVAKFENHPSLRAFLLHRC